MKQIKRIILTILTLTIILTAAAVSSTESHAAVKLNKKTITILKGKSYTIRIRGTKKKATWKTSRKSVARITRKSRSYVKIKGMKSGRATISARVGRKTYRCKVRVVDPKLNKKSLTLSKGKTYTLKVSGGIGRVSWKSSNTAIATVSSKGKVTAKKAGSVKITATRNKRRMTCRITVKNAAAKPEEKPTPKPDPTPAPASVKLSATSLTLSIGQTHTLKVTGSTAGVTWSTSNSGVASVNVMGKVTANRAGSATITAKTGGKSLTCNVVVKSADGPNPDESETSSTETETPTPNPGSDIKPGLVYYPEQSKALLAAINQYRKNLNPPVQELVWSESLSRSARLEAGYGCYEYNNIRTGMTPDESLNYLGQHHMNQNSFAMLGGFPDVNRILYDTIGGINGEATGWVYSGMHEPLLSESFTTHGSVAIYTYRDSNGAVWTKVIYTSGIATSQGSTNCPEDNSLRNLILNATIDNRVVLN